MKRRCRADKIACLSLSRITYLSIAHDQPEQAQEAELLQKEQLLITPESSPDERMALQLGKKLAQVLGTTGTPPPSAMESGVTATATAAAAGAAGVAAAAVAVATPRVDSPLGNNNFNISKAKKVELQNLSSRFSAAVNPTTPTHASDGGMAGESRAFICTFRIPGRAGHVRVAVFHYKRIS